MKTLVPAAIVIAAGIWLGWSSHQQLVALRHQKAELQQSVIQLKRCQDESLEQSEASLDTNELTRLRAERSELMKLRSELGQLRQAARLDLPLLQQQAEAIQAEALQEDQHGPTLLEERASALHSSLIRECLEYSLLNPLIRLAKANHGQFPTSFSEAATMLDALPDRERKWLQQALWQTNTLNSAEAKLIGRSFAASSGDFEFVPAAGHLRLNDAPVPVLRERVARRTPGGQWARWYGYTDGRTFEIKSADGTFSETAATIDPVGSAVQTMPTGTSRAE